jgi:hypothetical protein
MFDVTGRRPTELPPSSPEERSDITASVSTELSCIQQLRSKAGFHARRARGTTPTGDHPDLPGWRHWRTRLLSRAAAGATMSQYGTLVSRCRGDEAVSLQAGGSPHPGRDRYWIIACTEDDLAGRTGDTSDLEKARKYYAGNTTWQTP